MVGMFCLVDFITLRISVVDEQDYVVISKLVPVVIHHCFCSWFLGPFSPIDAGVAI